MSKTFILMSLAAVFGFSQSVGAGESQNPHDPVNQPIEESQNPHDDVNQPDSGTATGRAGTTLDPATNAAVPNPNSFGRTGRFDQLDAQNARRNSGVQPPPRTDNLDDRIEDINNDNRAFGDRIDGSPVPTADPNINSERAGDAAPLPPGQGPAVNPDASGNSTSTIRSDTGAGGNSGSTSTSGGASGSGAAAGSGSAGASSGGAN